MKADPTKKIRALASQKSRQKPGVPVYIDKDPDGSYQLAGRQNEATVMVYKNGNEIAL